MNALYQLKCDSLFTNILIVIRIVCTIYATAAEAERSFRKLKQIKLGLSVQRSVVKQN